MGNCGRNYNYSDSGWQQLVLGALASPPCWRTGDDDDDDGDDVGGLAKVAIIIMVMRMMLEDHNNGHEDGCDHLPIDDNDDNIIGKITMIMIRNVIFTFEYQ